jgi:hypothetical protein
MLSRGFFNFSAKNESFLVFFPAFDGLRPARFFCRKKDTPQSPFFRV